MEVKLKSDLSFKLNSAWSGLARGSHFLSSQAKAKGGWAVLLQSLRKVFAQLTDNVQARVLLALARCMQEDALDGKDREDIQSLIENSLQGSPQASWVTSVSNALLAKEAAPNLYAKVQAKWQQGSEEGQRKNQALLRMPFFVQIRDAAARPSDLNADLAKLNASNYAAKGHYALVQRKKRKASGSIGDRNGGGSETEPALKKRAVAESNSGGTGVAAANGTGTSSSNGNSSAASSAAEDVQRCFQPQHAERFNYERTTLSASDAELVEKFKQGLVPESLQGSAKPSAKIELGRKADGSRIMLRLFFRTGKFKVRLVK